MFLNAAYYPVQVVDEAGGSKTFSVPPLENQAEHLGLPEADYLDQLNETLKTRLEVDLSRTPYVKAKTEAELRKVRESILGLPMVPAKDAAKLRYHVARRIAKKINSPLHAASFIDLMMSRVGLDLFLSAYWLLRSDQKHLESVHLRHLFATCYCAILWIIEQNRDYLAEYLICLLTEAIFTSDPDPDLATINARNHEIAFNIAENFVRRYLLGLPTPKVTVLTGNANTYFVVTIKSFLLLCSFLSRKKLGILLGYSPNKK